MKIGIIGAGAAGLVAIKYSIEEGYECEAFEQTELIGGTWNYTDEVGFDKNGLPVHTSMYKNLRTNLPKEVMMFENFPYREHVKQSYITQEEVLEYLNDYAEKLNLKKHIKFLSLVTHVEPMENNKWQVEIQDVVTKKKEKKIFDAVVICNGKYEVPYVPDIPGLQNFNGNCIHSHDYRSADRYKDKVVLIVGGGPSGLDIAKQLHEVAKKVFCSFKEIGACSFKFPKGPIRKPLAIKIEKNTVFFDDGSKVEGVEEILLCTGFNICYPFLSSKCGIVVQDNYVKNVYKELLNINYPTMAILGIPGVICPIPSAEIQVFLSFRTSSSNCSVPIKPIKKHATKSIDNTTVYFEDGSSEEVDEIVLCTGYKYAFPFLDKKCGIEVDENYVKGLYKECLCIEKPTMILLGLPGSVCPIPTFEIQMRFFFKILSGKFPSISKDEMWKDSDEKRKAKHCNNRKYHKKGVKEERTYWDDLAETATVTNVPNVVTKIHELVFAQKRDPSKKFRLLNDEEFEEIL